MKKIIHFLRSMKFGMILLFLVMLCSLAGSLITQQGEAMDYVNEYGSTIAPILMAIGFTDIFHTWYFYMLEILLSLNLVLCSIIRFPNTIKAKSRLILKAKQSRAGYALSSENKDKLRSFLKNRHFQKLSDSESEIYHQNSLGFYGSFLTHLAILVVLLFGSLVLLTPKITDQTVMIGEQITLPDGTKLTCQSFHINNEEGKLDYTSLLTIENAEGTQSKTQEVRVNEPLRFGEYKIYQNTYGTAGRIRIHNNLNNAEEVMTLTDPCFLSIDQQNGIYFDSLYPGYIVNEDGSYTLVTATSGSYEDPVYVVYSISGGMSTSVLAFPDESITIGDITFTFLSPVEYPGLRIKQISNALMGALYCGFGLMVAALYLCFFAVPVCIKIDAEGFVIVSPKEPNGLLIDLQACLPELKPIEHSNQGELQLENQQLADEQFADEPIANQ